MSRAGRSIRKADRPRLKLKCWNGICLGPDRQVLALLIHARSEEQAIAELLERPEAHLVLGVVQGLAPIAPASPEGRAVAGLGAALCAAELASAKLNPASN